MIQWGRTAGHVALVELVRDIVGELLCRAGHHKRQVIQPGGGGTRYVICSRCGERP